MSTPTSLPYAFVAKIVAADGQHDALGDLLASAVELANDEEGTIVWFAVRPGLSLGIGSAALNGALLGAICYATYDLTNQATMRTWSTTVTVADIAWGAFATAVAAAAASFAAAKFA